MASNPYRPGASTPPLYLAGRSKEEKSFRSALTSAPELPANFRITGLRGVGKTVLLQHLEDLARSEMNWATGRLQVEPRHNSEERLTAAILALCTSAQESLSRIVALRNKGAAVWDGLRKAVEVEFSDFKFSLGGALAEGSSDLTRALYATATLAERSGKAGFVLMLDEAQVVTDERDRTGEHPLSMLIAAVNVLQGQQVPIGLVLCGLPTLKANLLKARTYTERMFRGQEVARLSRADTRDAFLKPLEGTLLSADADLVDEVLADVEGYPYFIQLWGASLWEDAELAGESRLTLELLEAIRDSIYDRLDNDFYDPRIESLTPAEQDLLLLTSKCSYPPLRTAEVHEHTERKEGNVNVLMGRLAEQGVVYRTSKGVYEYTAPKFHEYLQRRQRKDEWV